MSDNFSKAQELLANCTVSVAETTSGFRDGIRHCVVTFRRNGRPLPADEMTLIGEAARGSYRLITNDSNMMAIAGMTGKSLSEDQIRKQAVAFNVQESTLAYSTQMGSGGVPLAQLLAKVPEDNVHIEPLKHGAGLFFTPPAPTRSEAWRARLERWARILHRRR